MCNRNIAQICFYLGLYHPKIWGRSKPVTPLIKVARHSNGHKYPKQKQRTANLTSFAQIGLAIMFTTNSCVKHRILHVLRDADAISHVKTGEINADVLIADVIRKCNF